MTARDASQMTEPAPLGWFGIFRLGLVQAALGAIVVLTTSALNRIMVVEYSLAATIPGALVGFHYAIQLSRPRWGYGSDMGGSRTRWIIGGMAVLALGGVLAALGTALIGFHIDRYRRWRVRHIAAHASRDTSRAATPTGSGVDGLDHDDRRFHRHDDCRRCCA